MLEIISGARTLRITPFERECTPEEPMYDWIKVYVEFTLPELKSNFQAALTIGELLELKKGINLFYECLLNDSQPKDIIFESLENQVNLHIKHLEKNNGILVDIILRPEPHAESLKIIDSFGIDESYFPLLLLGINEAIEWGN